MTHFPLKTPLILCLTPLPIVASAQDKPVLKADAALNPQDNRKLSVASVGHELINPVDSVKVMGGRGKGVDIFTGTKFGDALIEVMVAHKANSGICLIGEYESRAIDSFGDASAGKALATVVLPRASTQPAAGQ